MTTVTGTQSDLFAWTKDLERENKRIAEIDAQRARNLGIPCSRPTPMTTDELAANGG